MTKTNNCRVCKSQADANYVRYNGVDGWAVTCSSCVSWGELSDTPNLAVVKWNRVHFKSWFSFAGLRAWIRYIVNV